MWAIFYNRDGVTAIEGVSMSFGRFDNVKFVIFACSGVDIWHCGDMEANMEIQMGVDRRAF